MSRADERVQQADLDSLCPELALVVADAVSRGNEVRETWRGWGNVVSMQRARPVLDGVPTDVREQLWYRRTDDPHSWRGEIWCRLHPEWCVVLAYQPGEDEGPPGGLAAVDRSAPAPSG